MVDTRDPGKGKEESLEQFARQEQSYFLQAFITRMQEIGQSEVGYASELNKQQRAITWGRYVIFVVASVVPVIVLFLLYQGLMDADGFISNLAPEVQIVLISGSFLTFVVVYSFFIRGLFAVSDRAGIEKTAELAAKFGVFPKGD